MILIVTVLKNLNPLVPHSDCLSLLSLSKYVHRLSLFRRRVPQALSIAELAVRTGGASGFADDIRIRGPRGRNRSTSKRERVCSVVEIPHRCSFVMNLVCHVSTAKVSNAALEHELI